MYYNMNKYLPRSTKNTEGFTLIELMIVISIIAVLSVVALGIFNGAQAAGRDTRRRLEIGAIAKNIESTKDPATGKYQYTNLLAAADYPTAFPANFPTDPGKYQYCIKTSTAVPTSTPAAPTDNTGGWQAVTCPTGSNWDKITDSITGAPITSPAISAGLVTSWTVCASLERAAKPFCVSSLTQ
jgi:prepilin-type N-terminal cleavage/methylation domain-containing protein